MKYSTNFLGGKIKWTEVERVAKQSIQEKKIRVTYLAADASTPPNEVYTFSFPYAP